MESRPSRKQEILRRCKIRMPAVTAAIYTEDLVREAVEDLVERIMVEERWIKALKHADDRPGDDCQRPETISLLDIRKVIS